MAFFNSKEEVIDIELTQYGKILLSKGLFKPAYYSLHDDDVLYDTDYAAVSENTNLAEVRIQEQTALTKPFYSFSEAASLPDINQQKFNSQISNLAIKSAQINISTLSDSTISNNYLPAWEIYNLSSVFNSSSNTYDNKNVVNAPIPQFDINITSSFLKMNQELVDDSEVLQAIVLSEEVTYDNETIFAFVNRPIVLKIIENNCDFENEAFEIEIFKVTKDQEDNDVFEKLKFAKEIDNYNSELDLYMEASNAIERMENIDQTYADYYFETLTDKEISDINVCSYILKTAEDQDNIFDDITICDDVRVKFVTNDLYETISNLGMNDAATGKNC